MVFGKFETFRPGLDVNSNIIKSVIEDREGNYWLGTWNGIFKYNGDRFMTYNSNDGLSNNNILSVFPKGVSIASKATVPTINNLFI